MALVAPEFDLVDDHYDLTFDALTEAQLEEMLPAAERNHTLHAVFANLHKPTSRDTNRLVLHEIPFRTPFPGA